MIVKELRHVGNHDFHVMAESGWIVCKDCGIALHVFVHEIKREGEQVYDQIFACSKCSTVRVWGSLSVPRNTRCRVAA